MNLKATVLLTAKDLKSDRISAQFASVFFGGVFLSFFLILFFQKHMHAHIRAVLKKPH